MKGHAVLVGDRSADEIVNDGEREAGSLAGPRLGETNQIPTFQRQRDCLLLDRRGVRVAGIEHRVQDFGRQIELREGDARFDYCITNLLEYTQTLAQNRDPLPASRFEQS